MEVPEPAPATLASDERAVRSPRTAAVLGIALGVTFGACFATGLFSHWAQSGDPLIAFPARPAGLYRVTQGIHIASGIASIPLLLAKLWVVLPEFFALPPFRSVAHAVERLALFPLVGGGIFLLATGLANIVAWYPWEFGFVPAHHWAAWIAIGGLVAHVGAKAATTRDALRRPPTPPASAAPSSGVLGRRGFLATVGALSAFLAASVSAQTASVLRPIGWFAPRDVRLGPQGFPVNSSARRRRVIEDATSPDYRLRVTGAVERELTFSLAELRARPLAEAELPIACVEGWSKSARWRGVPLHELLDEAGAADGATATIVSLQRSGGFRTSFVNEHHASDPDTLLALDLNGEPLHLDHGYPVRLIGPNRPGVNQTKWVAEVRVR